MRAASKRTTAKGQPKRNAEPVYKGDENGAEKRRERGIKLRKETGKTRMRTPLFVKNHHIARQKVGKEDG